MRLYKWVASEIRWKREQGAEAGCSWARLIWSMLWWPGEDHPTWLAKAILAVRRVWYVFRKQTCECPGCTHRYPAWWSSNLCPCCGVEADCCHEEEGSGT